MNVAAVDSIPLIAHLRKKGFKQNDNAAKNFNDNLSFNVSVIFRNINTLKKEKTPLKSRIENSGSLIIEEINAVIITQRGEVEP